MPKEADPLPADQVALFKRWIEQGAKFDGPDKQAPLASLVPKKVHPAPPEPTACRWRLRRWPSVPTARSWPSAVITRSPSGMPRPANCCGGSRTWKSAFIRLAYNADGTLLAAAGGTPGQSGEVSLSTRPRQRLSNRWAPCPTLPLAWPSILPATSWPPAAPIVDPDLRSGQRQGRATDRRSCRLGHGHCLESRTERSWPRPAATKRSKVFDVKTGESVATYPGHGETVYGVSLQRRRQADLFVPAATRIHVWNPADGKQVADDRRLRRRDLQLVLLRGGDLQLLGRQTAREHKRRIKAQARTSPATRTTSTRSTTTSPPNGWPPAASTARCASGTRRTASR